MPDSGNRYQIVLLVDVSLGVTERNDEVDLLRTLNLVRTSALKVLSCLASSSRSSEVNSEVQWGYKFYNSRSPGSQTARYGFRDLTLRNVEEFENELENRLEREQSLGRQLSVNHHARHGSASGSDRKLSDNNQDEPVSGMAFGSEEWEEEPVDKLKRCLMDIVHDFQWDRPVISSPVKRGPKGRGRKSIVDSDDDECKQHNLVFLYSTCPHSHKELQRFCDREPEAVPVLSSFLPSNLQRQMCNSLQLKLHWIDMGCVSMASDPTDLKGLDVMQKALERVSGGVIPVTAFLQSGNLATAHVNSWLKLPSTKEISTKNSTSSDKQPSQVSGTSQNCVAKSCEVQPQELSLSSPLIPVSSLVRYYLCHRKNQAPVNELSGGIVLHTEGGQSKLISHAHLQPIAIPHGRSTLSPRLNRATRSAVGKSSATLTCDVLVGQRGHDETQPSSTALEICGDNITSHNQKSSWSLVIRGTLPAGALPLWVCESGSAFMVMPAVDEEESTVALPELLTELARQKVILVCDYADSHMVAPALAILQPLTSVCATLTLVRSNLNFLLEKLLFFACDNEETEMDPFVKLQAGHVIRTFKPVISLSDPGGKARFLQTETSSGFDCHLMEKWYSPAAAASESNMKIISSLSDSPSPSKAVQKEAAILKKMQKVYMHAKTQRLSVTLPNFTSVNRSPSMMRGTPRKNAPKTPSKRTPKTPKRCPRTPRATGKTPKKSLSQLHKERKTPKRGSRMTPRKISKGPTSRSPRKSVSRGKMAAAGVSRVIGQHGRSASMPENRRGKEILERSRQALAHKKDKAEEKDSEPVRPTLPEPKTASSSLPHPSELANLDLQTEEDLLNHIQELYERTVCADSGLLSSVGSMLLCVQSYFKNLKDSDPEVAAAVWFEKNILKALAQLREKYQTINTDALKNQKCQEYQLQVLLHMEVAIHTLPLHQQQKKAADDADNEEDEAEADEDDAMDSVVQKMVAMLRGMSFLKNPTFLSSFLNSTLLHRYLPICPRLLGKLYEELLQPLPPALEDILSPDEDEELSSVRPPDSNIFVAPDSNLSSANPLSSDRVLRDRKLIRHPTFHAAPQRQISVSFAKPQAQAQGSKRRKTSGSKSKENAEPGVKAVRRNLFESSGRSGVKLERRQSVAVMERVRGDKTPSKQSGSAHPRKPKTPKSHHVLKTKSVTETPSHKQKLNQVWRRQEKERRRMQTVADVMVVAESPDKCALLEENKTRKLQRKSSLQFARRSSFYSEGAGTKSRAVESMEHFQRLEARIKGQGLLSPTWKEKQMLTKLTPSRRIQPKSLFSGLVQPSPDKAGSTTMSPQKLSQWARQAQFDSPSRNTRKRALFLSPERDPVPGTTIAGTVPSELLSPVRSSPRLQAKNSIFSSSLGSRISAVRDISPRKARRSLVDKLHEAEQDSSKATSPASASIQNSLLASPRPVTRLQTILLSPDAQRRKNPVFTPPFKENVPAEKTTTPAKKTPPKQRSPKQATRVRTTLLSDATSQGYTNPAFALPLEQQVSEKLSAELSGEDIATNSTEVELSLISPRRSKRLQSPLSQSVQKMETYDSTSQPGLNDPNCRLASETYNRSKPENAAEAEIENMVLSPRRSRRLSGKPGNHEEKATPSLVKETEKSEENLGIGNTNSSLSTSGDMLGSLQSELVRKLRLAQRISLTSISESPQEKEEEFNHSSESQTTSQHQTHVTRAFNRMSSKRKLLSDSEQCSSNEDLNQTPQKRRCTASSSITSLSSTSQFQDYFDTPEVFALSGSQTENKSPNSQTPSSWKQNRTRQRNLPQKWASLESNSESNMDYPVELGPHDEDSNSQNSAIFPSLVNKHLQRTISEMSDFGSDSDMSKPDSPIFASPGRSDVISSPPKPTSTTTTPPQHKQSAGNSPVDFKNFSPSISHKSLKQLIQSPLVSGGKKFAKPRLDTMDACNSEDFSQSQKQNWQLENPYLSSLDQADSNDSTDSQASPKRSWRSEKSDKTRTSRRSLYN